MDDAVLAKGDGESWADYAHRLEGRVGRQRDRIRSLEALRKVPGDKQARARIALLERILGKKEVTIALHREGIRALKARLDDPPGVLRMLAECLNDGGDDPWGNAELVGRMEEVFVALGGVVEDGQARILEAME